MLMFFKSVAVSRILIKKTNPLPSFISFRMKMILLKNKEKVFKLDTFGKQNKKQSLCFKKSKCVMVGHQIKVVNMYQYDTFYVKYFSVLAQYYKIYINLGQSFLSKYKILYHKFTQCIFKANNFTTTP